MEKINVLVNSEFLCNTGFAKIAEHIVKGLVKTDKYEFVVVAGNYFGEPYDHTEFPMPVFPGKYALLQHQPEYNDLRGFQRVLDLLMSGAFDILFSIYDPANMSELGPQIAKVKEILKKEKKKVFKWILYFPIESYVREHWVEDAISIADYPVSYTKFGTKEILKVWKKPLKIDVIPHGIDPAEFFPMPEKEIKEAKDKIFNGLAKGKYLVTNINRNQLRKDYPTTLKVFKKFKEKVPNALLYLHGRPQDFGGDFTVMANDLGLKLQEDYIFPYNMGEEGFPAAFMNMIYNVSDMIISTSLGEGWGLETAEAFATKKPFVGPDNTAFTEICADGRGTLAKLSGNFKNFGPSLANLYFETVDVDDMAKKMEEIQFAGSDKWLQKNIDNAYDWVQNLTWDKIVPQWEALFEKAYGFSKVDKKIERNQMCPCGSKKKFKRCCGL